MLTLTAVLPFLAIWDLLRLAQELNVVSTLQQIVDGALSILGIGGLAALLALTSTRFRTRERTLSLLEFPARIRWFGFFFLVTALAGYTLVFTLPLSRDLLGGLGWVRFLVFWVFSLLGMYGLKAIRGNISWLTSLLVVVIFQDSLHLLAHSTFQCHFLSLCDGMVGNQPLLLSFPFFVKEDIWHSPALANPASQPASVARSPVLV